MQVMPLLREILHHAVDKSHWLLRAKALECISLVGMAIGRERFREDAHKVLVYMQQLQARFCVITVVVEMCAWMQPSLQGVSFQDVVVMLSVDHFTTPVKSVNAGGVVSRKEVLFPCGPACWVELSGSRACVLGLSFMLTKRTCAHAAGGRFGC